ncbi:MAG TPA: 2-dehydro-3-deoxyphosphooctonate aldolase, partial [Leeuwenhoekiella sp.]|nr:2-dehydro-3-deoxyphosphooctonate aldolase [Leeuwenhoekiella sp.]
IDPEKHLVAGEGRKRLRSLRFDTTEAIDAEMVISFLEQAKKLR